MRFNWRLDWRELPGGLLFLATCALMRATRGRDDATTGILTMTLLLLSFYFYFWRETIFGFLARKADQPPLD